MEGMEKYDKWSYWLNLGISLDKLGNSVSAGSNKITISGRTGKYSHTEEPYNPLWKLQEAVINFAFYPVDGPNHCLEAYKKEKHLREEMREGNKLARLVMFWLIVLEFCVIIGVVLRIVKPIFRLFNKLNYSNGTNRGSKA